MAALVFDFSFHLNYLHDLLTEEGPFEKRIEAAFSFLCQILDVDEIYFNTFNASLTHVKQFFISNKFGFVRDPFHGEVTPAHPKIMMALKERKYYLVEDIDWEHNSEIHHRYRQLGIKGFMVYPTEIRNTLIGCIGLRNFHKRMYFEHSHLVLIRLVCKLLANIVEQEYGVFKYMINQNLYKHLFQSLPIPFVILNQEYKIIDVNPSFEKLFSILTYEIIFRDFFQVLDNYDNNKILKELEMVEPNVTRSIEIFKVIKGEKKILRLLIIKVFDEQTPYYGVGIVDITEQKMTERDLNKKAYYDLLTGLHNRNYFEMVSHELENQTSKALGIIYIKIDNLKEVNETNTYEAGDRLIYHVSESIISTMGTERLTARIGGGAFTVFIFDQPEQYVLKKLEDFYHRLEKIKQHMDIPMDLTVRMVYRENDWSIDQMLEEVKHKKKRELLRRKQRQLISAGAAKAIYYS